MLFRAEVIAQWLEGLSIMDWPWVHSPAPHKLGVEPQTCNLRGRWMRKSKSSLTIHETQGKPGLHETLSMREREIEEGRRDGERRGRGRETRVYQESR